jgi:hypothetical protein
LYLKTAACWSTPIIQSKEITSTPHKLSIYRL